MAAQTENVDRILLTGRRLADAETPNPDVDFVTDAELLVELNSEYRELIDLILTCGDAAIELLGPTPAVLTGPDFAVPEDLYRLIAVDLPDDGNDQRWVDCPSFHFRDRNSRSYNVPRYRLEGRRVAFTPTDRPPQTCQIWYVPQFSDQTALDSVPVFNGWDTFISAGIAEYICIKEDRDETRHSKAKADAAQRIQMVLKDLVLAGTQTVGRVEAMPEEFIDLVWLRA